MDKSLQVTHQFEAPVQHVGGAIERFVSTSRAWQSSTVDREAGTLVLMLRAGWIPWVDRVTIELGALRPGTTEFRLRLERSLPLSRSSPRRRHIQALIDGVSELVSG